MKLAKHTVSFNFDDAEDIEGLREELEEAGSEDGSKAEFDAVKKRIADFNARKAGRSKISDIYTEYAEVPAGGTKEANFELQK